MAVYSLGSTPSSVLNAQHITSGGKAYTLNYGEKTTLQTRFIGQGKSTANAQGWERNSHRFFRQLANNHPEMISRINSRRIANKQNPIVDQRMITHNPHFEHYKGDMLIHHHIGGDGEATALPEGMHKGSGDVHNEEKKAGITSQCKSFSNECQKALDNNPALKKSSVDDMRAELNKSQAKANQSSQQSKPTPQDRGRAISSAPSSNGNRQSGTNNGQSRGSAISHGSTATRGNRPTSSSERGKAISSRSSATHSDAQKRGNSISRSPSSNQGRSSASSASRGAAISSGKQSHSSASRSQSSNQGHSSAASTSRGAAISGGGHSHSSSSGHSHSSSGGHSHSSSGGTQSR